MTADGEIEGKGGLPVSRRSLLGGIALAPAIGPLELSLGGSRWEVLLSAYRSARTAHENFLSKVLDPVWRMASADALGSSPRIRQRVFELEMEGNDLVAVRHEALHELIRLQVDRVELLSVKMSLAYEEIFRFDDAEGLFAALLADVLRLSSMVATLKCVPVNGKPAPRCPEEGECGFGG